MTTDGAPLVEIQGLEKSYRRGPEVVHALRRASLTLHRSRVVALMGPSGSGKTTLLSILCGWERADAGEVTWVDGSPPSLPEDQPWERVAILPQDLGLVEELTVRENVELPLRLSGRLDAAGRDRATALLEGLGLDRLADRLPNEASLGEQQRTALARALVVSPRLLLADEPTAHQDAGRAKAVFGALRLAAREGTSCLVATHNPEAVKHVDAIVGIRDGRVSVSAAAQPARVG